MLNRNAPKIKGHVLAIVAFALTALIQSPVSAGQPGGHSSIQGRAKPRAASKVRLKKPISRVQRSPFKPAQPKEMTADEAVKLVRSGHRVLLPAEVGTSQVLVDALARRAGTLKGKKPIEVVHPASLLKEPSHITQGGDKLKVNALFINGSIRKHVGKFKITPTYLGEIPKLLKGALKPNVVFIRVSPPDKRGFVSMGANAGVVTDVLTDPSVKVIAEVNPNVPRSRGESRLHVSHIDRVVKADTPLAEYSFDSIDPVASAIGKNVAASIPNGATIQFGIGDLQEAVAAKLVENGQAQKAQGKKTPTYKVWTEIGSNGIRKLAEAGLVAKGRGSIRMGFGLGDRAFYDFLAKDKRVHMISTAKINDPAQAGARRKMVAINSGLAVDLYGQACSEMVPRAGADGKVVPTPYSGVGGQVDFFRAAARSEGGRGFLTLRSTAKKGTLSTITLDLPTGLVVTTNRYDMDRVATEWGVAELKGKDLVGRAQALVKVAHPKFRAELARQGQERFGGEAKGWQAAARVTAKEKAMAAKLEASE